MATPKKVNGQWTAQVYIGSIEGKRKYERITAETKAQWYTLEKELKASKVLGKKRPHNCVTVGEAVDRYISLKALLSPTTLDSYKRIRKYAFRSIMNSNIHKLSNEDVQLAINEECKRITPRGTIISAKTVCDEWHLIATALNQIEGISFRVTLPKHPRKLIEVPTFEEVFRIVKGTEIELPCLLAMWLSLSMSEIRGLKWTSIREGKLHIDQVKVKTNSGDVVKEYPKAENRTRALNLPPYIAELLENRPHTDDFIFPVSAKTIAGRFMRLMQKNGYNISFHKLRHINASVMAMLSIPTQYAQERGGWSTPYTMQNVYQHTFGTERQKVDAVIDNYFEQIIESN